MYCNVVIVCHIATASLRNNLAYKELLPYKEEQSSSDLGGVKQARHHLQKVQLDLPDRLKEAPERNNNTFEKGFGRYWPIGQLAIKGLLKGLLKGIWKVFNRTSR